MNSAYFGRSTVKKSLVLLIILFCVAAVGFSQQSPSFSFGLGMDFFNYEEVFLSTGALLNFPIAPGMEGFLGADFALWPYQESEEEEITPHFFIPINAGVQFIFDKQKPTFYLGMGLSPVFLVTPEEVQDVRFYMGPFLKGGLRVVVHQMMSWFIELQQDLAIGPPYWINTATRINTGINFKFRPPENSKTEKTTAPAPD